MNGKSDDLRRQLDVPDRLELPDVWPDAELRRPGAMGTRPARRGRVLAVVGAIVLALLRMSLLTKRHVPVSPVPIKAESNGRLAYLSGPGAGDIFGLARVVGRTPTAQPTGR